MVKESKVEAKVIAKDVHPIDKMKAEKQQNILATIENLNEQAKAIASSKDGKIFKGQLVASFVTTKTWPTEQQALDYLNKNQATAKWSTVNRQVTVVEV